MLFDSDEMFLNISGINDFNSKTGFLRGNMFNSEYVPYKNYNYITLEAHNDMEKTLFNVMQYSFAINDLNLYLDLHPDDLEVFNNYKVLLGKLKKAKEEYTSKFGSLESSDVSNYFNWLDDWPWENIGGSMYV